MMRLRHTNHGFLSPIVIPDAVPEYNQEDEKKTDFLGPTNKNGKINRKKLA
jgi:hypothetical protein